MDDKEEYIDQNGKIKKKEVIVKIITLSISVVLAVIILSCLYIIAKPLLLEETKGEVSSDTGYMESIIEAMEMIHQKYIDISDIDEEEMMDRILSGVASSVGDPYTRYLTDEEYQEMLTSGTEEYSGIGIHLTYEKEMDAIIVLGVMPSSPAFEADIKVGDYIVKVEDLTVGYDNYSDCVDRMKGQENTEVTIVISREGQLIEKKVTRKKIQVNNVESEILDNNIGYIKILQFENDIAKQFKTEYEKLLAQNIAGLVIDVRNNPGGLVTETIQILDLLLPKGEVLKLVYKDGSQKVYKCSDNKQIEIPLTVLVNENSASASEILASAIKDSGKGKIIGTKTFGKGIVQEIEKLETRGALSITVAKYYTASGIEINKNGIEPDIEIEISEELKKKSVLDREEDEQLNKAMEWIQDNL